MCPMYPLYADSTVYYIYIQWCIDKYFLGYMPLCHMHQCIILELKYFKLRSEFVEHNLPTTFITHTKKSLVCNVINNFLEYYKCLK